MRRLLAFAILLALGLACPAADKLYEVSVTPNHTGEALPEDSPRISVDFPNEEIVTILRNVADMYELNLVVPETLKGSAPASSCATSLGGRSSARRSPRPATHSSMRKHCACHRP
jgi:hypothetical protein